MIYVGRSHSHRPSPDKVAQRKRQAAYSASYRAQKRLERQRERAEREEAELAAIYDPAPPAPPPEPELLRCANCGSDRPADEFSPAAAARVRKGRSAWCQRCHEVRLQLLLTPHARRLA